MFCSKCGKQLAPDAIFCSNCGTERENSSVKDSSSLDQTQTTKTIDTDRSINHQKEVEYLFNLRGLELFILTAKQELQEVTQSTFPALPTAPTAPIMPEKRILRSLSDASLKAQPPDTRDITDFIHNEEDFKREVEWFIYQDPWGIVAQIYELRLDYNGDILTGLGYEFSKAKGINWCPSTSFQKATKKARKKKSAKILWECYSQKLRECIRERDDEYSAAMHDYETKLSAYNVDAKNHELAVIEHESENKKWLSKKEQDIDKLKTGIDEANKQLLQLYSSEKILPKPYQYAESVCYLYDFLSSASDDYNVKYALERVDFSEMKIAVREMIQNQGYQILMQTIQNSRLESIDVNTRRNVAALENIGNSINAIEDNMTTVAQNSTEMAQNTAEMASASKAVATIAKSYYDDSRKFLAHCDNYLIGRSKPL